MRLVENRKYSSPVPIGFEPLGVSISSHARCRRATKYLLKHIAQIKSFSNFPRRHEDLLALKRSLHRPVAYFLLQDEHHTTFHFTKNRSSVREFVKRAELFVSAFEGVPRSVLVELFSRIDFSVGRRTLGELEQSVEVLQAYIRGGRNFAAERIPSGQAPRLPYISATIMMLVEIYEDWSGEKFNPNRATAKGYLRREYVSSGPLFVQLFFQSLEADVTIQNMNSVLANLKKTLQEFPPKSASDS